MSTLFNNSGEHLCLTKDVLIQVENFKSAMKLRETNLDTCIGIPIPSDQELNMDNNNTELTPLINAFDINNYLDDEQLSHFMKKSDLSNLSCNKTIINRHLTPNLATVPLRKLLYNKFIDHYFTYILQERLKRRLSIIKGKLSRVKHSTYQKLLPPSLFINFHDKMQMFHINKCDNSKILSSLNIKDKNNETVSKSNFKHCSSLFSKYSPLNSIEPFQYRLNHLPILSMPLHPFAIPTDSEISSFILSNTLKTLQNQTLPNIQDQTLPNIQDQTLPNIQDQTLPNIQDQTLPNIQDQTLPNIQDQTLPNIQDPSDIQDSSLSNMWSLLSLQFGNNTFPFSHIDFCVDNALFTNNHVQSLNYNVETKAKLLILNCNICKWSRISNTCYKTPLAVAINESVDHSIENYVIFKSSLLNPMFSVIDTCLNQPLEQDWLSESEYDPLDHLEDHISDPLLKKVCTYKSEDLTILGDNLITTALNCKSPNFNLLKLTVEWLPTINTNTSDYNIEDSFNGALAYNEQEVNIFNSLNRYSDTKLDSLLIH